MVSTNFLIIDLLFLDWISFLNECKFLINKSIIKKLIETKKVRKKIIKLKQDINKPDFGRS